MDLPYFVQEAELLTNTYRVWMGVFFCFKMCSLGSLSRGFRLYEARLTINFLDFSAENPFRRSKFASMIMTHILRARIAHMIAWRDKRDFAGRRGKRVKIIVRDKKFCLSLHAIMSNARVGRIFVLIMLANFQRRNGFPGIYFILFHTALPLGLVFILFFANRRHRVSPRGRFLVQVSRNNISRFVLVAVPRRSLGRRRRKAALS